VRFLAGLTAFGVLSACSAVPREQPGPTAATGARQADPVVREADRLRAASQALEEGQRLLRDAEGQLTAGNAVAAIRILEEVMRRFPDVPIHDRALYECASALVLVGNASGDYRPALAPLDRLLREHPTSAYATDARALRMVIGAYIARTAERERLLNHLKAVDLEFERPPQP
jgi:hypothetical protein